MTKGELDTWLISMQNLFEAMAERSLEMTKYSNGQRDDYPMGYDDMIDFCNKTIDKFRTISGVPATEQDDLFPVHGNSLLVREDAGVRIAPDIVVPPHLNNDMSTLYNSFLSEASQVQVSD